MCVFPLHPGSWSLAATSLLVHFDLEFGKGYMHIVLCLVRHVLLFPPISRPPKPLVWKAEATDY
ncbi:hypothetical protein X797_009474 [Metarhizium robertsii]|uniref:Uncharacterized protein n=1 Tax=Metarhizium robertsii TaxID=568076 RepID=A0A0A1UQA9_9HYPO|nr:hypothetical protein X797_009474 [Metarhizium robertsii]